MADRSRWDVLGFDEGRIICTAQKLALDEVTDRVNRLVMHDENLRTDVGVLSFGTTCRLVELSDDQSRCDQGARLAVIVKDTLTAAREMQEVLGDKFLPIARNQRILLEVERRFDRDWTPEHLEVARRVIKLCKFWEKVVYSSTLWVNDVAQATPEEVDRLEQVNSLAAFLRGWGLDRCLPRQSAWAAAMWGAGGGVVVGAAAGAALGGGAVATGGIALAVGAGVMALWCFVAWLGRVCSKANYQALKADCRAARLAMQACKEQQLAEQEVLRVMEQAVSDVTVCLDQGPLRYASRKELGECMVCLHEAEVDSEIYVCGWEVCSSKHYTCKPCYVELQKSHRHHVCPACQRFIEKPTAFTIRL